MEKHTIALLYDFDKTLSTRDMQEFGFLKDIIHQSPADFWQQVNAFTKANQADPILSYLWLMLLKAREQGICITRELLQKTGQTIEFFPGVLDWFELVNQQAQARGLQLEHYILSSGLCEIIEGTPIGKYFKRIYGCEYCYDKNGAAFWPKTMVNYTVKTQYLYRINKGILDLSDPRDINAYMPYGQRRIGFSQMVYIGDGLTDVPCMRLVKENGGIAIAVYAQKSEDIAKELLAQNRVKSAVPADYRKDAPLYGIVMQLLDSLK